MKAQTKMLLGAAVLAMAMGVGSVDAAPRKQPAQTVQLSADAQQLADKYSTMLAQLKAEIVASLPAVDAKKKKAFVDALAAEQVAEAGVAAAEKDMGGINKAKGLVGHAQGWIKDAEKQVAQAQAQLKTATDPAQRQALEKTIADQQARREAGVQALKEREAALVTASADKDRLDKQLEAAKAKLDAAKAATQQTLAELDPKSILSSSAIDAKLIKYQVLSSATPRGLAEFASQGAEQAAMVESLLGNDNLMREMVLADGAKDGKYGQALQIYNAIQKASPRATEGPLQRLAMAVSLEHATPIKQSNPAAQTDAPATVDPVNRYLAFEKAFLAGELDPAFKDLTTWDYRFVVDGDEPDHTLAWGRQMLRNYRPDHVSTSDYRWRYVESVKTDVQYGSQDVKNDLPTLQPYQNMIMNGGVCGRRAFFGRFILRSFGIPTIARPQTGHAALAHWTPDGWVINLGAGWGGGFTKLAYGDDVNFLQVTQARKDMDQYLQTLRAHWIGDVEGETRAYGFGGKNGAKGFWNGLAIVRRGQIAKETNAKVLAAVGEDLGEANESKVKEEVKTATIADEDRKIVVSADGVITIPAAACSSPKNNTGKIRFMKSQLGGMQLHYNRTGKAESFEYTFDAPAAGKYKLVARVVTTSDKQTMQVSANGAAQPVDIAIPFTVGEWGTTPAVDIELVKGQNVLKFSRPEQVKGLTIKDFTLTPVK